MPAIWLLRSMNVLFSVLPAVPGVPDGEPVEPMMLLSLEFEDADEPLGPITLAPATGSTSGPACFSPSRIEETGVGGVSGEIFTLDLLLPIRRPNLSNHSAAISPRRHA